MNMKKLHGVLAVAIALLATAEAKAQSDWTFGVKAGLNLSDEAIADNPTEMLAGLHVGGVVNYRLNDPFDIEVDLVYSQQGVVDKGIWTIGPEGLELSGAEIKTRSHYLNLPVALKWYGNDSFYVECGPQFGYQLSRRMKLNKDADSSVAIDATLLKRFDVGAFLGVGYVFGSGLLLNARYVWGFTDTAKDSFLSYGPNRNLQLSVGYLF